MEKLKKKDIRKLRRMERIGIILISFLILIFVIAIIFHNLEDIKDKLENCKQHGWDGIKFKTGWNNEVICSNFTQAEKDAIEVCENKSVWVLVDSFWIMGNFTKDYSNNGYHMTIGAGGGGGRLEDENGGYMWKDNTNYAHFCPNGTVYTGGAVYPEQNRVQINCNREEIDFCEDGGIE